MIKDHFLFKIFYFSSEQNGENKEALQTNDTIETAESKDEALNPNHTENNPDDTDNEDENNGNKQKFRHSDSLYLLRKKTQHEGDDTSDDESDLSSSSDAKQQPTPDGV